MRKRRRNPPGLRARNGRWHYRFTFNGKVYQKSTGLQATASNRLAAIKIREEHLARVRGGISVRTDVQLRESMAKFLAWSKMEHRDHPNTWKRQSASFASVTAFFEGRIIGSITAGDLEEFKTWRRECGIKDVTIRHDLHAVSQLFKYSVKHGWASDNPVDQVAMPSDLDSVNEKVLADDEEKQYFEIAKKRPTLYGVTRLMVLQGLRPDEALNILKANVQFDDRRLLIPMGKSRAARRTLNLADESLRLLARRMSGESPWVFPGRKPGTHYSYSGLVNQHNEVLKESGLLFDIYSFRHTFATRFYQQTKDITALAKVLGHADLRTVQRYVHVTQEHMDKAMQEYEAYLKSRSLTGWEDERVQ